MKNFIPFLSTAILISFLFLAGVPYGYAMDKAVDSAKMKQTVVTTNPDEKISSGKNIVYCSTFQLAWNELAGSIIKGDIHLVGETLLSGVLNKFRSIITKNDLSSKDYVAMAGYGKDKIVNRINAQLSKKFGKEAWTVKEKLNPDDILAFSFLMKNLAFKTQFDDNPTGMRFNSGSDVVKAFGILKFQGRSEKMAELSKQVDILYYNKEKKEFIVRLITENQNEELILAAIEPDGNIYQTWKKAEKTAASVAPAKLGPDDILQIPEIDLFIDHSYKELIGKRVKNKGFGQYQIAKAQQVTKFKLDKTGAFLKSKAEILMVKGMANFESKKLIFNKPFLLYMKEKKGKNPYYMMWVDNPEVMVKN
ncbi:MAG: hypothetical protein LWY06_10030 [Firmicutes bacterium]|nr:hypothetical protein [Bacillota bacterium]